MNMTKNVQYIYCFFFKDILSKDKFSIFNKEKNIELIKFKNIVENYNKSKPINE